jgi:flagellar basal-body rod protein FlgB
LEKIRKKGFFVMDSKGIFSSTISTLEKVLDARSLKHNLIVSNIANADTPNYKAFDLIIEEEIGKTSGTEKTTNLTTTHSGHLRGIKSHENNLNSRVTATPPLSIRGDGNSVDIDKEMAAMAENNLMYNALAQILSKKFTGLKNAIQEGRR